MRWRPFVVRFALFLLAAAPLHAQLADPPRRQEAIQQFRAGQEYLSAEQFEKAAEAFSKAIERDRLLSIAHYGLGQANMNLRRYASAIKAYKDSIEAMRTMHDLQQTSKFDVDRQREDEIRELKSVLDRAGMRTPTRLQLEQRLRDLEDQRHAGGVAFRPPAEVLLALGSAYFRNGEIDGAEANWKAAVEVNARYGEAHNNLAVIYMQKERFNEAEQEVRLAEKNGFRVNPQFKQDLANAKSRIRNN